MNTKPDSRHIRSISRSVLFTLALSLVMLSGCADMVTYSVDSQRAGERMYKTGDYADAAGAFRNSVRQNPRNYQGYYYLACCYDQMGQYQMAIANYRTARQTVNLTLEGKYDDEYRAKILTGLAGAIAKSDQRNVEVDAVQQEAEQRQSPESWYLLAKIYEFRGDADSSLDAYNRAALLDPNNFLIVKDFGLYLEHLGQRERAEAPLRHAYSLNSKDQQVADALRRIGVVPGPGILTEAELAKPQLPRGPLPEMHIPQMGGGSRTAPADAAATVQAPRD